MKKCVIYARVSTDKQDWTRQLKELEEYAKKEKLYIDRSFKEQISGASKIREEFEKMIQYITKNKIKLILCHELSRFGRNTADVLNKVEELKKDDVNVFFLKEKANSIGETAADKLLLTTLAALAEMEREQISQRTKSGRLNKIKQGSAAGFPIMPFGFTKDENGMLQINEKEADVVKEIYRKKANGESIYEIIEWLNESGVPTRNPRKKSNSRWQTNNVNRILHSSLYKGERIWKNYTHRDKDNPKKNKWEEIKIDIHPIVDVNTWDKVQEIYKKDKKINISNLKIAGKTKHEYLFKGLLYCGHCGWKIGSRTEKRHLKDGKVRNSQYYFCYGRKKRQNCKLGQINKKPLDDLTYLPIPHATDIIVDLYDNKAKDFDIEGTKTRIKNIEKLIKDDEKSISDLLDLLIEKVFTKEEITKKKETLEGKIKRNKQKLKFLNSEIDTYNETKRQVSNLPRFMKLGLMKDVNRREILIETVEKVLIYNVDSIHHKWPNIPCKVYNYDYTRTNKKMHSDEKQFYVEIYLKNLENPLKLTFTSQSMNLYSGNDLLYDKEKKHLDILDINVRTYLSDKK